MTFFRDLNHPVKEDNFIYPPVSVPIDKDDNTIPFPSLASTDPKTNFLKDSEENTINTNPENKKH